MAFEPRRYLSTDDPAALRRELFEVQREIAAELARRNAPTAAQTSDYAAGYGETVRLDPPAAGLTVTLPPPIPARVADRVTLLVLSDDGAVTVECTDGLVSGAASLALTAGVGLVEFALDGETGWFAPVVSPSLLAPQADDTGLRNVSGATAPPAAEALSAWVGSGIRYNATAHEWQVWPRTHTGGVIAHYWADDFWSAYWDSTNSVLHSDTAWFASVTSGGSIAHAGASAEHPGLILLTTAGTGAGDVIRLVKGRSTTSNVVRFTDVDRAIFVVAGETSDIRYEFGWRNDFTAAVGASDEAVVAFDDTVDANVHFVTSNGGASPQDTNIGAADTNLTTYEIRRVSSTEWRCYRDGTLVATHTSGAGEVPGDVVVNFGLSVEQNDTAAVHLQWDFVDHATTESDRT